MTELVALDSWHHHAWESFSKIYRFSPYRNHRIFSSEELVSIGRSDFFKRAGVHSSGRLLYRNNQLIGGACWFPMLWDSHHFSLSMGMLDVHLADSVDDADAFEMISAVLSDSAAKGILHFSVHVDVDDYQLFNLLTKLGFRLVDSKAVYVSRAPFVSKDKARPIVPVRELVEGDEEGITALFSRANFKSRYTRDLVLPAQKSSDIYARWMQRLCRVNEDSRVLFVVEKDGVIVGCGGIEEIDFSGAGVGPKILGNGMFACDSAGTGAYYSVMHAGLKKGLQHYPLMEMKVSLNNRPVLRVLESLGCEMVGVQHALHLSR